MRCLESGAEPLGCMWDGGEEAMGHGRWAMGDGRWAMGDGGSGRVRGWEARMRDGARMIGNPR
jgi:hypothetical protein